MVFVFYVVVVVVVVVYAIVVAVAIALQFLSLTVPHLLQQLLVNLIILLTNRKAIQRQSKQTTEII